MLGMICTVKLGSLLLAYKSMTAARPARPTKPLAAIVAIGAPPAADEELEAPAEALEAALLADPDAEEAALDADSETDEAADEADSDAEEAPAEALLEASLEADEAAPETEVRPLASEPDGPVSVVATTLPAESVNEVTTPKIVAPVGEIKVVNVLPPDVTVE